MRTLDLPPLEDEKALAAAVKVQAPDHIPMPMDEAVLDWQSLGTVAERRPARSAPASSSSPSAARWSSKLVGAAREAGLTVEGIDLSAFGMVRALADRKVDRRRALRQRRRPHQRRRRQRAAAASSPAPPPAGSTRWSTRSPSVAA